MTAVPGSAAMEGRLPPARPMVASSLRRQLTLRFAVVFLLVAVVGSVVALSAYRGVMLHAQRTAATDMAQHIQKSYASLRDDWRRNADEVKAQIDFMRVFADGRTDSWLRLRAYFAALEGKVGKFPSGVVLGADGQPLFDFGVDGAALRRFLTDADANAMWFQTPQHRTVHAIERVRLWLGPQGSGQLVLLQPLDAATMSKLAPPDVVLLLVHGERVMASSAGSRNIGQVASGSFNGRLEQDGVSVEQRAIAAFEPQTDAPRIVMQQVVREPLGTRMVLLASTALLASLALRLWLVVGRWASELARRVVRLSQATGLFAQSRQLGPQVQEALDSAIGASDEITEVAQASRHLMHSVEAHDEEHFAFVQTLNILEEGVVEVAKDGRYVRASPGWIKLAGDRCRMDGQLFDSIHPEDASALQQQFAHLFAGTKTNATGRLRLNREANANDSWVEYRFVPAGGGADGVTGVRGVMRDITQSYLLEKHVSHMALHDALTDLPNRVLLEDRAKVAIRMAVRGNRRVAIGFIDLDHFKDINDHFGHSVGDQVLVSMAGALRNCLRAGDTLARWGGDEFVVLLSDLADLQAARDVASKMITACERAIVLDGSEFNVTFSMGIAVYPDDADNIETLLSQADRAMFHAKELGRNNVHLFTDMVEKSESRRALYIQNRLAAAVKNQQLQVWFQPVVSARDFRIVGCEALARWHDQSHGWVSPATFIPMAENLGLIAELGTQVWREAFRGLQRWRAMGQDLYMAVNISRRQFYSASFTQELLADLERFAVPALCVELEVTESVAMEHAQQTANRLQELVDAGFGIAIDDFGTGYSSLSQLHTMPASKLKIDISFVRRIHEVQGAQLVVAIVKMAQAFNLETVAEGVEDAATAQVLRAMGVTMLQGYHFGKPMPMDEFELLLTAAAISPGVAPAQG